MRKAFTLIELLVVITIIALLASITTFALAPVRRNARDTVRKTELNEMGKFLLTSACYAPQEGPGDYDLKTLYDQLSVANPQLSQYLAQVPRDPKLGSPSQSGFRYVYAADGHCALYANLERPDAAVDLPNLTAPTPGGGAGILRASATGPNGTDRYYQIAL